MSMSVRRDELNIEHVVPQLRVFTTKTASIENVQSPRLCILTDGAHCLLYQA
jgi:hypothetical protein